MGWCTSKILLCRSTTVTYINECKWVDHNEFWVDWVYCSYEPGDRTRKPLPMAVPAVAWTNAQVVNSNSTSSGKETHGPLSVAKFDLTWRMSQWELVPSLRFFFFKFLEDMSPFCGAIDTPVSDFWWRLLWVSKPEWVLPYSSLVEAYMLCYTFPEIHLWCDTCWPLGGQHGSQVISSTHTCEALVGLETGSYHATAHSVRSGRCSTDWAIPAWLPSSRKS